MTDSLATVGASPIESWNVMREKAATLVKSGFLPKAITTPEKAIAVMQTGQELGIGPMQSFRGIHVIEGKPSLAADLMAALVYQRVPGAKLRVVETNRDRCVIEAGRPGDPVTRFTFDMEDAKEAGLLGKDNWRKWRRAMLRSRCMSETCHAVFPDAIMGLYTPEEMESVHAPSSNGNGVIDAEFEASDTVEPLTDAVNQKLQDSIDKPKDRTSVETDADWRWPLRGKNHDKKLSEMSDQDLVYYSENAKDQRLRDVAGAEVDRRINKQAKEFDESTKGSYLDGNGGEATEGEVVT